MGGAVSRPGDGDTAFSERGMPFVINAVTGWHDPAESDAHADWARAVVDAAADASTGRAYVNFLADADAAEDSYGAEKYAALQTLKRKYDPTNLFRLNQNVEPGAEA
jgi:FAD/FMN-containing dehydrogenase